MNVSIATSLHQRLPFSGCVYHLSSPDTLCLTQTTFKITDNIHILVHINKKYAYTYTNTYSYTFTSLYIHKYFCHRHHNIRNGIVWAQTGHNTGTCTATLCVIEPRTHLKFESFKKIFPQRRKSNSNLLISSKKPRNRSNWFRAEIVSLSLSILRYLSPTFVQHIGLCVLSLRLLLCSTSMSDVSCHSSVLCLFPLSFQLAVCVPVALLSCAPFLNKSQVIEQTPSVPTHRKYSIKLNCLFLPVCW